MFPAGLFLLFSAILRLNPASFPALPKPLSADLQRRGCTVPQVEIIEGAHNVIKGSFAKPGQTDWAVLCSANSVSSVVVYWNASPANPAVIEPTKDSARVSEWEPGKNIFDRKLEPVDKKYILDHYEAYGGEKPPPIDHQGINDIYMGKASVVLYFYQGKWLHLQGAD